MMHQQSYRHWCLWTISISATVLGLFVLVGYVALGLRINTTASMPMGLWRMQAVGHHQLQRGDIVFICPPKTPVFKMAYKRGYISRGICPSGFEPLLKRVVALPHDDVVLSAGGISVNGNLIPHSTSISCDAYGRTMPVMSYGHYSVEEGMVWVLANTNPASFDGRYWGALPIADIEGLGLPVWVIK